MKAIRIHNCQSLSMIWNMLGSHWFSMKVNLIGHLSRIPSLNKKQRLFTRKRRRSPRRSNKLIRESLFLTKLRVRIKKSSMSFTTTMKVISHRTTKMPLRTRHLAHTYPNRYSIRIATNLGKKWRTTALTQVILRKCANT